MYRQRRQNEERIRIKEKKTAEATQKRGVQQMKMKPQKNANSIYDRQKKALYTSRVREARRSRYKSSRR